MFEELWDLEWPTLAGFDRLREDLDSLLGAVDGQGIRVPSAGAFPLINVGETPRDVRVYVLAPGLEAGDLELDLQGNLLSIHGRRSTEAENEDANQARTWYRHERFHGEFRRTVSLPEGIDPAQVDARAADGLIRIVIGKRAETQPRKISVKSA